MARSILVADGDKNNRELLSRLLKIFGYDEVSEAADGLEALSQIVQKSPDLVVLDTQLSKLDGYLLTEILHNVTRFREIPVALMSASMDASVIEKGMLTGAYAFLEKPLTPEGIKGVLGGIIAPSAVFPEKMTPDAKAIVAELGESAKRVLTLIFGQQGKIISVEEMPAELKKKVSEIAGVLRADGAATIEIALGMSQEGAKVLAKGLGKTDFEKAALGQALGEVLNSIFSRSAKRISEIFAVKAGSAQVQFNAPPAINPLAKESYVIHLRVVMQSGILRKQLALVLWVTITQH